MIYTARNILTYTVECSVEQNLCQRTRRSPVYRDALTNLPIVTMSKMIPETGSFLAIDIKNTYFEVNSQDVALPESAAYYLVDQNGELLYCQPSEDNDWSKFQQLVDSYKDNDDCKTANHISENIEASDGIVRNVYFHHMDNGWTGILTIPKDEILSGCDLFRNICIVLVLLGIALVIFQVIREYKNRKTEAEFAM